MAGTKSIKYAEPKEYMPKEIREKYFKNTAKKATTSSKKSTKKSK